MRNTPSQKYLSQIKEGVHSRNELIQRIIRVDHAGEFGAKKIYEGQLAVFRGTKIEHVIHEMAEQEKRHLSTFENLINERRVRPTILFPFWNAVGYTIGVGSALLGKEAAMAVTVAVEDVISEHYNSQIRIMNDENLNSPQDIQLKEYIKEFRDEEVEHHDIGLKHNAEQTPFYQLFTGSVRAGTKLAIWLSERI